MVQPEWTIIIRNQESRVGLEKFQWASAIPRECGTRCPQSSAPGENKFVLAEHRLIPSGRRVGRRANGTMQNPQEEYAMNLPSMAK
jgi:hypothetical protein